ncbi:MAG: HAD-IIA family hydrolase [Acidimicrobiia bacterium]|nr:HAD-IIA family hydrolase [Acidimicrobiia bacterium]
MAWVLDLDGVVWLDHRAVPGAAEAVDRLRRAGEEVLFVTNNAFRTCADTEDALAAIGIPADGAVLSSAMAAGALLEPGQRVFLCAGPGVEEVVAEMDNEVLRIDDLERGAVADVVLVGLTTAVDYPLLRAAAAAVRAGARYVATNTDATYPTPKGLAPGAGAIVAAVTTAAGRPPDVVAGKPHEPIAEEVRRRLGNTGIVVGDRLDTDGAFATVLGYEFVLVLSGVASADDPPGDPLPALVADDLLGAVTALVRRPSMSAVPSADAASPPSGRPSPARREAGGS